MAFAIDILKLFRLRGLRPAPANASRAPTLVAVACRGREARPAPQPRGWRRVAGRVMRGLGRRSKAQANPPVAARPAKQAVRRKSPATGLVGWVSRPLRAVASLLLLDVKMRRDGGAIHIVIGHKAKAPLARTAAAQAVAEAAPQIRALKRLLNQHALTRHTLRHLAYVERGLATKGLAALGEIPVEVLEVALAQLDAIVSNWSDRDLAEIRSRMAVSLKERTGEHANGFLNSRGEQRSDFMPGSRLLVGEASHSVFLELERQYQDFLPQDSIRAALDSVQPTTDERPEVTCVLTDVV